MMDKETMIGNNLHFLRESNGYSQKELSGELGFSVSSISEHEYGKHLSKTEILLKYSQFYAISLDRLMGEDLSEGLVFDYYYQNNADFMDMIELILPTAKSETAMLNEDFKEGWRNLETVYDFWKTEIDCDDHLIEKSFKCFARSALYDSLAEGAVNAIKLYIFMDSLVLNEKMERFIKKNFPLRSGESVMKKNRRLLLCNDETLIEKRKQLAEKWGWSIPALFAIAKGSTKWNELADYYDAMMKVMGINAGGNSLIINRDVGLADMIHLWQKDNVYVKKMISFFVINGNLWATDDDKNELLKGVII